MSKFSDREERLNMEIGILGLTFHSGNKGCEALSYSFLNILEELMEEKDKTITVNILVPFPIKNFIKSRFQISEIKETYFPKEKYKHITFNCIFYVYKLHHFVFFSSPFKCSKVFDFTAGDSFTDIYGEERFWARTNLKKCLIDSNIPLILGSQTIGPFNSEPVLKAAISVINNSREVYVRDRLSYDYVKKISGRNAKLTSDIAFALPYNDIKLTYSDKPRLGFNVSGLLWSGGYTQNNQFDLTVDYREYCRKLVKNLLPFYEIHLIPHAFTDNQDSKDNDFIPAKELHREFPETILCDALSTPIEIKSYISQMNLFLGARMHATIAAFSTGVPVIPFSYSRKFEGLFESLHYNYVIHGKESSTFDAINTTLSYIERKDDLKKDMMLGLRLVENSNEFIKSEIKRNIFEFDIEGE